MTIQWFGHSCFRIETKEGSTLIDPFSKEIGLRPPRVKDDLVLISHEHYDHNDLQDIGPETFVIRGPGEYERKGIHVRGVSSFHDNAQGAEKGLNTMYIIKAEDMTLCHLGDLGQDALTDEQVEAIGDVDVLMVPVGGTHTLDAARAVHVVQQIEPKIIIPMHYKMEGLKIDLDPVQKFVKEIGLTPEKVEKYRVAKKTLPTEETHLVMFA
jgi:L-ascorbate metabolism protein UlaG (beta-lactamase superfamily)